MVFEDNSCLSELEAMLTLRYHLFTRRASVLRMVQKPGQLHAQWVDAVVKASREAEMSSMTPDQLQVHVILAGFTDPKAKEKVMELEDPIVQKLKVVTSPLPLAWR